MARLSLQAPQGWVEPWCRLAPGSPLGQPPGGKCPGFIYRPPISSRSAWLGGRFAETCGCWPTLLDDAPPVSPVQENG